MKSGDTTEHQAVAKTLILIMWFSKTSGRLLNIDIQSAEILRFGFNMYIITIMVIGIVALSDLVNYGRRLYFKHLPYMACQCIEIWYTKHSIQSMNY